MKKLKILGIVLITAGSLGLAYGAFTYTKETHQAEIGSVKIALEEKETVTVPPWLSVGMIVAGAIFLFTGRKT